MSTTSLTSTADAGHIDMHELAPWPQHLTLTDVVAEGLRLSLVWNNGDRGQFPLLWLRDHCACDQCRHPLTRERLVTPMAAVPGLDEARIEHGQLHHVLAIGQSGGVHRDGAVLDHHLVRSNHSRGRRSHPGVLVRRDKRQRRGTRHRSGGLGQLNGGRDPIQRTCGKQQHQHNSPLRRSGRPADRPNRSVNLV